MKQFRISEEQSQVTWIEILRRNLHNAAAKNGLDHPETLRRNQYLDKAVNFFYRTFYKNL